MSKSLQPHGLQHTRHSFLQNIKVISSFQFSCSVMSDSLRPHELQHARPPCPSPITNYILMVKFCQENFSSMAFSDFIANHFTFIFIWELVFMQLSCQMLVSQLCPTLCDPMDCSPPGSSAPGILQERLLEWVLMPSSRGSSQLKDQTHIFHVSCIAGIVFIVWAMSPTFLCILNLSIYFRETSFLSALPSFFYNILFLV